MIIFLITLLVILLLTNKLSKPNSFLFNFTQPIVWFISATLISIVLIPIGLLYDIGKNIKELNLKKGLYTFWVLIKAILISISWLLGQVAIFLDLIWNICAGELIEDCVTGKEDTEFRKTHITVSGSIGKLKLNNQLHKYGKWFDIFLDKVFSEKDHSLKAYRYWSQYRSDRKIK